jgi:hypothetical protein
VPPRIADLPEALRIGAAETSEPGMNAIIDPQGSAGRGRRTRRPRQDYAILVERITTASRMFSAGFQGEGSIRIDLYHTMT